MKTAETLPNYVWISFKVWAPNFSRVDNRMFLLGSVSELGSWSLDSALEAESTSQMHIWRVDSVLPVGRHIEWTWLTTRLDKSNPRWETPTKRLLVTDAFSGTVHTIFSDPLGVFIRASSCVELTTYKQVDEGYTVVVTGNSRTIGQWDILKAVEAIESPRNSGYWKAVISFDALTILQFKWAVIKLKDRKKVLVIEKNPHSIYGRHTWIRAVAPWSLPEVVIVDTALKTDVMDIYDGRSDIIVKERKKREKEIQYWLSNSSKKKGKAVPLLGIEKVQVPTNIPRTFVTPRTSDTNLKEILPQGRASTMSLDRPSNLSSVMMEQEKESPIKGQLSRAEKLSMEFSKLYQVDPRVMSRIKGKGSSFTNEVAGEDENVAPTEQPGGSTYGGINPTNIKGQELFISDSQNVKNITDSESQSITKSEDSMLDSVKKVKKLLESLEENASRDLHTTLPAVQEDNVSLLHSYPLPTWEMMVENSRDISERPPLKTTKGIKVKDEPIKKVTSSVVKAAEKSLLSMKKVLESNPPGQQPFKAIRTQSANVNPSWIGEDELMKSAKDIIEEEVNRSNWERKRELAHEEERTRNTENSKNITQKRSLLSLPGDLGKP